MTPKFSKSDAYRTTNKIVGICNEEWIQFLLKDETRDGEYEGRNYWDCFDIYDVNGIRFHIGNGASQTNNYSSEILSKLGKEAQSIGRWTDEDIKKRKELLKQFCTSIEKGIHDPAPVTTFGNFKKQLVEQHNMWPEKSFCQISKELLEYIPNLYPYTRTEEIKNKINDGLKKELEKLESKLEVSKLEHACFTTFYFSHSVSDIPVAERKMEYVLRHIFRKQRDLNLRKEKKNGFEIGR